MKENRYEKKPENVYIDLTKRTWRYLYNSSKVVVWLTDAKEYGKKSRCTDEEQSIYEPGAVLAEI